MVICENIHSRVSESQSKMLKKKVFNSIFFTTFCYLIDFHKKIFFRNFLSFFAMEFIEKYLIDFYAEFLP